MNEKSVIVNGGFKATVDIGSEKWEKSKENVFNAYREFTKLPIQIIEKQCYPDPLFRFCVEDLVYGVFKGEYAGILNGKDVSALGGSDNTLKNLLSGFKDLNQIKSLSLLFKASIEYDDKSATVTFWDFSLLGYSTTD